MHSCFRFNSFKHIKMSSSLWIVCMILASLASAAICATPRRRVAVPFRRNYVPTWAFDHIKYFIGGSEIQLLLDKYTGAYTLIYLLTCDVPYSATCIFLPRCNSV